jgi:hypothetical protein
MSKNKIRTTLASLGRAGKRQFVQEADGGLREAALTVHPTLTSVRPSNAI